MEKVEVENSFFLRLFGLFPPFFSFFFGPKFVISIKKVLATLSIYNILISNDLDVIILIMIVIILIFYQIIFRRFCQCRGDHKIQCAQVCEST